MPGLTREVIRFKCEHRTPVLSCPVQFSWLGPARPAHSATDEGRDLIAAARVAESIGWLFRLGQTFCPRHAPRVAAGTEQPEVARA